MIRTLDPIMEAHKLVEQFDASRPAMQKAMIKAFAITLIPRENFPEGVLEMWDTKKGKRLARLINIGVEEGETKKKLWMN